MSFRTWLYFLPLGLALATSGHAQEQAPPGYSSATTEQNPPETYPIPFPVEIVEDQAEAEARHRGEEESSKREISNLVAQEGINSATQAMNGATQRMAEYAFWSTIFVAVGTALLIVTLYFTRQANKAAQRAIEVTEKIGKQQLRAYVGKSEISMGRENDAIVAKVKITNFGQTPALDVLAWVGTEISEYPLTRNLTPPQSTDAYSRNVMFPSESSTLTIAHRQEITDDVRDQILAGTMALYVFGRIEYTDFFGEHHVTTLLLYSKTDMNFPDECLKAYRSGNDAD